MEKERQLFKNKEKFLKVVFLSLVFLFSLFFIFLKTKDFYKNEGRVFFLDVGQGDAIFIKTPKNYTILIDGGPSKKILFELSEILPLWERKIDLVLLTHPHADHLVGLCEVLKNYKVGEVWLSGVIHPTPEYQEFLNLLKEKNIPTKIIKMGDRRVFPDKSRLEILWPKESLFQKRVEDLNHFSVVARFSFGENQFLFTGDIDQEAQREILKNFSLKIDVLKIPHHGGEEAILEDFLKESESKLAVICVGKDNKFGHPARSTLELLKKYKVNYFRTDEDGQVIFSFDEKKLDVLKNTSLSQNLTNFLFLSKIFKK